MWWHWVWFGGVGGAKEFVCCFLDGRGAGWLCGWWVVGGWKWESMIYLILLMVCGLLPGQ